MENKFIKDNDIYLSYDGKFNRGKAEPNKAYSFRDKIYIYRGFITTEEIENDKETKEAPSGVYINSDTDKLVRIRIEDHTYSSNDILVTEQVSSKNKEKFKEIFDIGKNVAKVEEENKKKKVTTKKTAKEKRKLENDRRIKRNEIIKLRIRDDDNLLVQTIKNEINESEVTMNDIYSYFSSAGYNMFYGLSTRSTITWEIFEKWCEFLGIEPEINLKRIK
jgi:hypothetical protein